MKLFREENGEEVVYIQCKDLNLIENVESLSRGIDIKMTLRQSAMSNKDEFVRVEDPKIVSALKNMYFIVDYDEFSKLSDEEINKKIIENRKEIAKLNQKKMKREDGAAVLQIFYTRTHYEEDIKSCIYYKKNNEEPKFKISQ